MENKHTRSSKEGLERLCNTESSDWFFSTEPVGGVELLEAWFVGHAYTKHRHDTYAVSLTKTGIQVFDYRGSRQISTPGQVSVLHPDEPHNGKAGTEEGLGYQIVYVEPAHISESLRVIYGRPCALPFVRTPISTNIKLKQTIQSIFKTNLEPLAVDSFIVELAEGLVEEDPNCQRMVIPKKFDVFAMERVRAFLREENHRIVKSSELEKISGFTRYDLARQFRLMYGVNPYRYMLMRRLDFIREQMHQGGSLVELALDAGFADQAHFTRCFKSAFGLTPSRYRALRGNHQSRIGLTVR